MKVYIAGQITGDKQYRKKFAAVEKEMKREGDVVLNPATLPEGMTPADYMRICFSMIDSAELVVFLPGFTKSRGALLEYDYSHYIGKRVLLR